MALIAWMAAAPAGGEDLSLVAPLAKDGKKTACAWAGRQTTHLDFKWGTKQGASRDQSSWVGWPWPWPSP
jgi:hypothetical protein